MPRRLGELGCTGPEARERLKRLLNLGLGGLVDNNAAPLNDKQRGFIRDMTSAIKENPDFEPSFGQLTYAQDIYDKFIL